MRNPLRAVKEFTQSLGLVEQAQVVSSTAVVVTMATIITSVLLTEETPRWMDFISIIAVGAIGFANVLFSLNYSRQLDEQRRQIMAISTIADAVNRFTGLSVVLETALGKITDLLGTTYGWIYMVENNTYVLRCSKGTLQGFPSLESANDSAASAWMNQPRVEYERINERTRRIDAQSKAMGIQSWASTPLRSQDVPAGVLIVAGRKFERITAKKTELIKAFGNQISVALTNAELFNRLKQSEQRYLDLFEHAPDMYLSIDHAHIILGCNATGVAMLEYAKEEIIGQTFEKFFYEEQRTSLAETVSQMFTAGVGVKDIECVMMTGEARQLYVTLNCSMQFDAEGKAVSARIVARDITERKKMEAAILHAQKIDSIGNLAGGIAHDFNNILAAILGSASIMRRHLPAFAESLKAAGLPEDKHEFGKYVEIVEGAARRASSLTRQLLTFARKNETVIKAVGIHPLIEETLLLFQRSVSKEIAVQKSFTTDIAIVNGDEGQIQQALLNLLLNARDAMPGGGTVTISTTVILADAHTTSLFTPVKPGPFVGVTVTDTGVGMDKAMQSRIFEPWFTTKELGTGLGLSVVYGVVQSHGGFINLESEAGRGTSFSLYLPSAAAKARSVARQRRQQIPRGTENILVIDDELSVCEVAKDMLTTLGYNVLLAHDGKEAVELYRTRQAIIDLVLLDVNMPLMGGKEAFRQLRMINPNIRIIIITGHGKREIEDTAVAAEMNAILLKPFQLEELAVTVRQVLDNRMESTPAP